jgi:serine/threonine protein phosphatase PrpC
LTDQIDSIACFGVFDGHNGSATAEVLEDKLHRAIGAHGAYSGKRGVMGDRLSALEEAIDQLDQMILRNNRQERDKSGSTLVVVVVDNEYLYCGNVGDARAVLCRNKIAVQMSTDHKPYHSEERKRIVGKGGIVIGNYMLGKGGEALAVSRAIGDVEFRSASNDILISTPTMSMYDRTEADDFIIIASDGLYDVFSNQQVCDLALKLLEEGVPVDKIAQILTERAIEKGSTDNVTVIVVFMIDPISNLPKHFNLANSSNYTVPANVNAEKSELLSTLNSSRYAKLDEFDHKDLTGLEIETENSEHYDD